MKPPPPGHNLSHRHRHRLQYGHAMTTKTAAVLAPQEPMHEHSVELRQSRSRMRSMRVPLNVKMKMRLKMKTKIAPMSALRYVAPSSRSARHRRSRCNALQCMTLQSLCEHLLPRSVQRLSMRANTGVIGALGRWWHCHCGTRGMCTTAKRTRRRRGG